MKISKLLSFVVIALMTAGCMTHVSKVGSDAHLSGQLSTGSHKMIYANFVDDRPSKDKVGMISALMLNTQRPVGDIMADQVAYELNTKRDYSVEKVHFKDPYDKSSIINAMRAKNADIYIVGSIIDFDIASVDALLHPANCRSRYEVRVYNQSGDILLQKSINSNVTHFIGLAAQSGSDMAIQKNFDLAVKTLMYDGEFVDAIQLN